MAASIMAPGIMASSIMAPSADSCSATNNLDLRHFGDWLEIAGYLRATDPPACGTLDCFTVWLDESFEPGP
jgi:hypothetical protein